MEKIVYFVVLRSVFFCKSAEGSEGSPAAPGLPFCAGPLKAGISVNPAADSTKVKILQLQF